MWTFDNLAVRQLHNRYGFTPSQQWLDHVRLSPDVYIDVLVRWRISPQTWSAVSAERVTTRSRGAHDERRSEKSRRRANTSPVRLWLSSRRMLFASPPQVLELANQFAAKGPVVRVALLDEDITVLHQFFEAAEWTTPDRALDDEGRTIVPRRSAAWSGSDLTPQIHLNAEPASSV